MMRKGAHPELVGRSRFVEGIVTALEDTSGFGAMIVGEAGVGKSAVAHAVVEQLRWSAPVLKVTGGPSLRSIPFGALAPYLHALSPSDADSPVAVLRAVMSHLTAGRPVRPQHPPLMVVDDAHQLDDSSSALLSQLISARRAKVLLMIRDSRTATGDFGTLTADGLLARFDLQPLEPDAVEDLCSRVVGGPVLTGTSRALALATGGNPMYLRMLLERGLTEGHLVQRNGIWRLTGELPVVDHQLGDLIRSQLRARDDEDVEALEIIALAEPVALAVVSSCVGAGALKRLRDDRLITIGAAPAQPVSLDHPLYGEVLRNQVPTARSMVIRRRVLTVTEPGYQSLEGFLRDVSWGLDCGNPADDRTLLKAAVIANGLRDYVFALRAARAVSAPGLHGRVLTEIARVQAGRGDLVHAQELVDEALRQCTDLRVAKDATLLSFELKLRSGAPYEDLRDDVARWRTLIGDQERRDGERGTAQDLSTAHLGCRILDCHVLILEGRFGGVEESLRALISEPGGTAETRVCSMILLAAVLGSTGRSVEGSEYSGEALTAIETEGGTLLGYREFAIARHVLLLTNSGRSSEARALLSTYSRSHPRDVVYFAGWGDFVDGIDALRGARNRDARDRFLLALEALRGSDVTQVVTLLTGLAAYACALAGDAEQASALIDEFERAPERGSRTMRLGGRIFVTATSALLGDAAGAAADLVDIATAAEEDSMTEVAVTAFRSALLFGDTGAVDPLLRVLPGFEGAAVQDLVDFVLAVKAKDLDAMVAAATASGARGDVAFEFAGLSLALRLWGEQGPTRQTRAIQRRLVTLSEQRQGPLPSSLAASPAAVASRLTPTEQKIATLVKEGFSNREIAVAQGVSVRTVEGHLYRIFAKLGVNRREDLREP